jgi:hypothetical protein
VDTVPANAGVAGGAVVEGVGVVIGGGVVDVALEVVVGAVVVVAVVRSAVDDRFAVSVGDEELQPASAHALTAIAAARAPGRAMAAYRSAAVWGGDAGAVRPADHGAHSRCSSRFPR